MCSTTDEDDRILLFRFVLLGLIGSFLALCGLLANGLLATLFLTRAHYRHSPFFFLGFVALFDTLLDSTYILLMSVPVNAEYSDNYGLFLIWLNYLPILYLFGQIFKLSSVFCLVMASIERYCMTKHWTFTGFERRTRWFVLLVALTLAVLIKNITVDIEIREREECMRFRRFIVGSHRENVSFLGLINTVAICVPFLTLIYLNGGIVVMLRRQNIQQLRSLITELTMGHDVMKIRRKNLRSATRTLIVIISAYLISNLLTLALTLTEFFDADFLHVHHPLLYRMASDLASLLTVIGNVIRCPAHFLSNSEIRQQFAIMFFGAGCEEKKVAVSNKRRQSERLENPWLSLLLTVHEKDEPQDPLLGLGKSYAKRHSTIAIC